MCKEKPDKCYRVLFDHAGPKVLPPWFLGEVYAHAQTELGFTIKFQNIFVNNLKPNLNLTAESIS